MAETRAFSRQLVAYLAAFLPTSPYYRSNDSRIAAVCDDQYSATLAMLEETADETFKAYLTRKTQGWFRRWGCDAAAASPGPGAAAPPSGGGAGAAGAATPGRLPVPDASDDEGGSTLITPGGPAGGRRKSCVIGRRRDTCGVGHSPCKTSRLQRPSIGQARLCWRVYSH